MDPSDGLPSSSGPGSDPEARPGRQALDLLARDLEGGLTEVIADRYVVGERLGHGAHGTVHRAQDRLTGETVAIKLLPSLIETDLVRLRGEIAALRLLRLPGVAHLFDEGSHHGRPFLVMELVEGEPFPGSLPAGVTRWTWEALSGPTLALLDTLARVHATGLVHRDLKPRNVLVTRAGRPVLLDFGLSVGRALAEDSASDTRALGTPAYAAPEQCRGEPVDARADLYALGVMLWEALAGRRPHAAANVSDIIRSRLEAVAEPLARYAPDVPLDVQNLIDQLLEIERDDRPRSAVEVAERLRGEARADGEWELKLVGRDDELRRLVEAGLAGRPACVLGPRGWGHTRLLSEAAQRLAAAGCRVLWAQPGSRPFESLAVLAGWIAVEEPSSVQAALQATADGLRRALADGVVLLVDDLGRLDEWSSRVLDLQAPHGAVLASAGAGESAPWGEAVLLRLLWEDALRGLFAGEDRLLHVHEDAARELWERTAGVPSSVRAEIEGWLRAGLVETAGAQLLISRAAVDRLRGGLNVLPVALVGAGAARELDEDVDELLAWIHLAWPNTQRVLLEQVSGRTAWLLEAEVETLCECGAARVLPDGRVRPLRASRRLADGMWLANARGQARSSLAAALAPGVRGRLYHLVAAGEDDTAAREALIVAADHVLAGRLGDAEVALAEGLRAARRVRGSPLREVELQILREWLSVAIREVTPLAADRLLYELGRSTWRDRELTHLEKLVRVAVAAYESDGPRALAAATAVPPFGDAQLEQWRQGVRVLASRRCSIAEEERVVTEACAWIAGGAPGVDQGSRYQWEARLRYRQGRYAEAADLYLQAASHARLPSTQLSDWLNAASALLEAHDLVRCSEVASRASQLAATCRHALFEGRAEWLARAAAYRRGEALIPDSELVGALASIGSAVQTANAAITEAAIAWRSSDNEQARRLAALATQHLLGKGHDEGIVLARSLEAAASGRSTKTAELQRLQEAAARVRLPEVGLQALALLCLAGAPDSTHADALIARLPALEAGHRLDVLSLAECFAMLGRSAPEPS